MSQIIQQHKGKITIGALTLCSAFLLHFVGGNEGIRHYPYKDVGGVLTVCDGHTGKDVIAGKYYSTQQCQALETHDITIAGQGVIRCSPPLNQNEYNAYTDFAYNEGVGRYCGSSMIRDLKQGNHKKACNDLIQYDTVHHKVWAGLKGRRDLEIKICLKPDTAPFAEI